MKKLLLAATAALSFVALATPAFAQLAVIDSVPNAVGTAHIGLVLETNSGSFNQTYSGTLNQPGVDMSGQMGGLEVGYSHALSIGGLPLLLDGSLSGVGGSVSGKQSEQNTYCGYSCSTSTTTNKYAQKWLADAKVRIGTPLWHNIVTPFVMVGYAVGNFDHTYTTTNNTGYSYRSQESSFNGGMEYGGGFAVRLSEYSPWYGLFEYTHKDLSVLSTASQSSGYNSSSHQDAKFNGFMVSVGYQE